LLARQSLTAAIEAYAVRAFIGDIWPLEQDVPNGQQERREAQAGEMRNGGSKADEDNLAVYAELQPIDRHRSFIDHLFVLRDRGRLTGVGRNLFASPFSEIALVSRRPDDNKGDNDGVAVWKAIHLPPRFGRQPRQHSFHGWMLGIRCRPLDLDTGGAALAGLSELFTATVEGESESPFDPIIGALDAWIDHLRPRLNAATTLQLRTLELAAAVEGALSASGLDRNRGASVASLAATVGVVPRTLQRHFRNRTGLAPKRYAAVQRFSGALRQVALGSESLAHIAAEAGYSDQAHLTTDLGRHAGLSPGRFRAQAQRQIVRDAVRFFKDVDLQNRVRLLVCDSGLADDEATDGKIRSEGCKLRGSCPDELRAPNRNGDVGH
jgi:AraC-like DNA-binding protein